MEPRSASASKPLLVAALALIAAASAGCQQLREKMLQPGKPAAPASTPAQKNAEILAEMFHVIFGLEPRQPEFGSWVDTKNQGASIEGIYNGLTHSARYRSLELQNPGASPAALSAFAEELTVLEAALPKRTQLDETFARPLPVFGGAEEGSVSVQSFPGPGASKAVPDDDYRKMFRTASIFTLKRVLGDEALKVISAKGAVPGALAQWYGGWAARIAAKKVDFGLPLRNKPDEGFHRQWATRADPDQLAWEVLNRLHRLLNDAQRKGK